MRGDPDNTWWRCEVRHYSVADEWGEHSHTRTIVEFTPFALARSTPKGVWLRNVFGGEFFVRGSAIRQRAVPTKDLAVADAIARKERHVAGCQARMREAENDLAMLQLAKKAEDREARLIA